ncbi:amino acid ABC transporter permease [Mesorhizobium sp. B2-4-14]|uniref:amino acid ABC transporter permease n=1 Tax=Mesorhizobium sp. B2-4-14 TaxID=2589935 RepID=UPI00112C112A|nr:amino acid ABC transporter permease [Mesorhizobium sp. B2-4-14]TPK99846.1 amino acid ABC transporter permease [Mesorhizobium sp. B2-4-14]
MQNIDFFFVLNAWPALLEGLKITLQLTVWANIIGLAAGFPLALLSNSRIAPIRWIARFYIDLFRCTPVLVQVVWFFFCIPMIFDVFWSPIFMGILILGMNQTAFNGEAFRAAIQSIPAAQRDAGVALGLGRWNYVRYVVLPQAIRTATPGLITNAIGIFQQSSLVALVGVADLMYQGKLLSTQTYRPIETFTFLAAFYLAVAIPFGRLAAFFEHRLERIKKV